MSANLSDDIMNLIDVAAALKSSKANEPPELIAVLLMNKHCYIQNPFAQKGTNADDQMLLKRSVEIKQEILEVLFGWVVEHID